MPNARKLEIARPGAAQSVGQQQWRDDVDPRALPPTNQLTAGQRRVLEACVELFGEQGFPASSIRDIATAAGMQSASLYNHFPSKDAILHELAVIGYEHHLDRVLSAVLNASSDPRDQLLAAIRAHVTVHCEYANLGVLITYEVRHVTGEVERHLTSIRERSTGVVIEILRRGAEQGYFGADGHHVAILAMASMGVDSARWFPYQTKVDATQLADDFARLALRMVAI